MLARLQSWRHQQATTWTNVDLSTKAFWHSLQGSDDFNTEDINSWVVLEIYTFETTATSLRGNYRKTSNLSRNLVGNKIVDHSDVVGASPVGAAPTTSSFST